MCLFVVMFVHISKYYAFFRFHEANNSRALNMLPGIAQGGGQPTACARPPQVQDKRRLAVHVARTHCSDGITPFFLLFSSSLKNRTLQWIRGFAASQLQFIQNLVTFLGNAVPSNFTLTQKMGLAEICEFIASGRIKFSVSDKDGEFVVMRGELNVAIARLHFQDQTLH